MCNRTKCDRIWKICCNAHFERELRQPGENFHSPNLCYKFSKFVAMKYELSCDVKTTDSDVTEHKWASEFEIFNSYSHIYVFYRRFLPNFTASISRDCLIE